MFDKLEELIILFEKLTLELTTPEVLNDHKKMIECNKKLNEITSIVEKYQEYKAKKEDFEFIKESIKSEKDSDMREMMLEELKMLEDIMPEIEQELKILLLPKDPNDDKSVIIEIRGGAGGDEAALFAGDLFRMYIRYAERRRWKVEVIDRSEIGVGGLKEAVFMIHGQGAYSRFKFESGVHRVQRVPATESSGRIHTSTATVAVMPELEEVERVVINPADLRVDTFRSSGAGGQHVNMTDSAVRMTHLPTGIVVSSQEERSQIKNRETCMKVLAIKLYELELEKQRSQVESERRSQVGTGDRSEKIRTYNFPQGRVTDHRIKMTIHQLDAYLDGDLDEMIDSMITFTQTEQLQNLGE